MQSVCHTDVIVWLWHAESHREQYFICLSGGQSGLSETAFYDQETCVHQRHSWFTCATTRLWLTWIYRYHNKFQDTQEFRDRYMAMRRVVVDTLDNLPNGCSMTLWCHYWHQYNVHEIAFMITTSWAIHFGMAEIITNETKSTFPKSVQQIIDMYHDRGFRIKHILSDLQFEMKCPLKWIKWWHIHINRQLQHIRTDEICKNKHVPRNWWWIAQDR